MARDFYITNIITIWKTKHKMISTVQEKDTWATFDDNVNILVISQNANTKYYQNILRMY